MDRWPQFRFNSEVAGVFEETMGLVDAGKGNAVHQALARAHGARLLEHTRVESVEPVDGGALIHMPGQTLSVRRVVIAGGAWTDHLLSGLGHSLHLRITQEQVTYYRTPHLRDFTIGRFPTWAWQGDDVLYGFPVYGEVATKVAIDAGGHEVTADSRDFTPDRDRERRQHDWLGRHIPDALGPILYTKTCLYDLTRDRNFVLDHLPGHPQILIASGAGHAYKFAALIGRIMSELAIDGHTDLPIDAFAFDRPAVTDPTFDPYYRI
jgi:sarcosine oxidase